MSSSKTSTPREFFRDTPVRKLIFKLSWPSVIGMSIISLYSVVDSMYIGNWGGADALAAMLIAGIVEMCFAACGVVFGVGSNIVISTALGAGDVQLAEKTLGGLAFGLVVLGIAFPSVVAPLARPLVRMLGASTTTEDMAAEYARYISFAAFGQMSIMAGNNVLRSEGRPLRSMVCMVISACSNIIIDPILIFVFDLGVKGAALSTLCATLIGSLVAWWPYITHQTAVRLHIKNIRPSRHLLSLLKVGLPSGLANASSMLAAAISNMLIAHHRKTDEEGDLLMAAIGGSMKIILLTVYPVFGLNQGLAPVLGFTQGAGAPKRFRHACKVVFVSASAFVTVSYLLLVAFSNIVPKIFSREADYVDTTGKVIRLQNIGILTVGLGIVAISVLQNLRLGFIASFVSTSRQFVFFVPFAVMLTAWKGIWGVVYAQPAADFCFFLLSALCLYLKRHPAHFVKSEDAEFVQKTVASLIERGLPYDCAEMTHDVIETADVAESECDSDDL